MEEPSSTSLKTALSIKKKTKLENENCDFALLQRIYFLIKVLKHTYVSTPTSRQFLLIAVFLSLLLTLLKFACKNTHFLSLTL